MIIPLQLSDTPRPSSFAKAMEDKPGTPLPPSPRLWGTSQRGFTQISIPSIKRGGARCLAEAKRRRERRSV
jgi:hypothetical protein